MQGNAKNFNICAELAVQRVKELDNNEVMNSQCNNRSFFDSRAVSVQVDVLAVSDHVFQMFHFDLLIHPSYPVFVHPFRFGGYRSRV